MSDELENDGLGDLLGDIASTKPFDNGGQAGKNKTKKIIERVRPTILRGLLANQKVNLRDLMPLVPELSHANALGTALGKGVAGAGIGLEIDGDGEDRQVLATQANVNRSLAKYCKDVSAYIKSELGMTNTEFMAKRAALPKGR